MKICPRCGKETMRDEEVHNSLSRICNQYICDDCGTAEAMEDYFGTIMPLSEWACNRKN